MSGKNDEMAGFAFVIAFFGAGMLLLGMFIFAVALIFAIVLTIVALFAWDKPLTLFGETLYPHEARWFVYRGLIGMAAVPAFVWFFSALYGLQVEDALWSWLVIGGYAAGSVGIEFLAERNGNDASPSNLSAPETIVLPSPPKGDDGFVYGFLKAEDMELLRRIEREGKYSGFSPKAHASLEGQQTFKYASWDDEEARR